MAPSADMSGNPWPPPWQQPPPLWPPNPVRPAPATLILARVAAIGLAAAGLLVGLLGASVIAVPTTMMVTGCSGDSVCLKQFFWVFLLPFIGTGLGFVVGLVGIIVGWRSHWVIVWGVIAVGLSVAGILAALRIVGMWPHP
ncbi:MAG: hypothetical protein L0H26_11030 [Microlunatus sp.]|nr:hypothetical protein [Microlunatus sp.]